MYYTVTDLVNQKIMSDKATIDTAQISHLIESDIGSAYKIKMKEGASYYKCRHDILDRVRKYYVEGEAITDTIKANNKIQHPFHKILVNQKTAYICSNPINVNVRQIKPVDEKKPTREEQKILNETKEFEEFLTLFLGVKFDKVINDLIKGSSNKGVEWLHFFINKRGELNYIVVPAEQIIAVYDTQYEKELLYIIRFYLVDLIDEKGKTTQRYKVEWWTKDNVEYWEQNIEGNFMLDSNYAVNPAAHWTSFNTNKPSQKNNHSWDKVPFIPLYNNSDQTTDLEPIKELIDSYDLVKSGWCNDLEEFDNLVYIIKGYQGLSEQSKQELSELTMLVKNIRESNVITTEIDGAVSTLKAEIPVEAKEKFLQITRREIFYFGEGVDLDSDKFANAPSGVALQFLYTALDLKADRTILELQIMLKEFMWFIVQYINMTKNKKFDYNQILFTFNKSQIFNELEIVQLLNQSKISRKLYLEKHPYIDDVNEEIARQDAEEEERRSKGVVDLDDVEEPEE